jgi:hypothetical protein
LIERRVTANIPLVAIEDASSGTRVVVVKTFDEGAELGVLPLAKQKLEKIERLRRNLASGIMLPAIWYREFQSRCHRAGAMPWAQLHSGIG